MCISTGVFPLMQHALWPAILQAASGWFWESCVLLWTLAYGALAQHLHHALVCITKLAVFLKAFFF